MLAFGGLLGTDDAGASGDRDSDRGSGGDLLSGTPASAAARRRTKSVAW